ncbi:MAG: site-2 protease family protein [Candidatus Saganbacteria bacterium]|nr:site-2 protease family protein [Candidatus Saganbacteria bacterium]
MRSAIKVGTLIGIPIEINYSWLLIFGLVTWTLATLHFPYRVPGLPPLHYWIASVIAAFLLFVSLLLHELAHSYIAQKKGLAIKKITLFIFGGVAQMESEPELPNIEFQMALAGPFFSLSMAAFSFVLMSILTAMGISGLSVETFRYLWWMNVTIAVFNMIPGFPLDGGRVLRAVIWHFNGNLRDATRIATIFGKLFSFAFMMTGLFFLYMMQFVTGIWFIVIGLFLHEAAELCYQQLILKKALLGVPVRDVMVADVITVHPELTIDRLIRDYFYKHRHMGFPVVENGKLLGLITLQDVGQIPDDRKPLTKVRDLTVPAKQELLICPEHDALEALLKVTKSGLGKLLVVENGRLLGIIAQTDLVKLFEIKTHLCR